MVGFGSPPLTMKIASHILPKKNGWLHNQGSGIASGFFAAGKPPGLHVQANFVPPPAELLVVYLVAQHNKRSLTELPSSGDFRYRRASPARDLLIKAAQFLVLLYCHLRCLY
jgi:hypothetical protein